MSDTSMYSMLMAPASLGGVAGGLFFCFNSNVAEIAQQPMRALYCGGIGLAGCTAFNYSGLVAQPSQQPAQFALGAAVGYASAMLAMQYLGL